MLSPDATEEELHAAIRAGRLSEVWALLAGDGGALLGLLEVERPGLLGRLCARNLKRFQGLLPRPQRTRWVCDCIERGASLYEQAFPRAASLLDALELVRSGSPVGDLHVRFIQIGRAGLEDGQRLRAANVAFAVSSILGGRLEAALGHIQDALGRAEASWQGQHLAFYLRRSCTVSE